MSWQCKESLGESKLIPAGYPGVAEAAHYAFPAPAKLPLFHFSLTEWELSATSTGHVVEYLSSLVSKSSGSCM